MVNNLPQSSTREYSFLRLERLEHWNWLCYERDERCGMGVKYKKYILDGIFRRIWMDLAFKLFLIHYERFFYVFNRRKNPQTFLLLTILLSFVRISCWFIFNQTFSSKLFVSLRWKLKWDEIRRRRCRCRRVLMMMMMKNSARNSNNDIIILESLRYEN